MKNIFLLSLLASGFVYSMERDLEASEQLSIIIPEEDRITEIVMANYFREHTQVVPHIQHYMRQRIRQICDSPHDAEFACALRKVASTKQVENTQILHDLVFAATAEALKKQEEETNKRWTKKKSVCCAGVTGLLSTLVTAGVTLAIHFSTQQCGGNS